LKPPTKEAITIAIALWGAITGTVALILQYRIFRKDRAKLVVEPSFTFYFKNNDYPPSVNLKTNVFNVGRRPITISQVFVRINPDEWWKKPVWWLRGKGYVRVNTSSLGIEGIELTEGKGHEIAGIRERLLKEDVSLHLIKGVRIIDQTGRKWVSKNKMNYKQLKLYNSAEKVKEERVGKERSLSLEARMYKVGKQYQISCSAGNSASTHHRVFRNLAIDEAESKFQELLERGQMYVEKKINIDEALGPLQ